MAAPRCIARGRALPYIDLYAWLCVPPRYGGMRPPGPVVVQGIPSCKYGGRISKAIFWPAWKTDTFLFPSHWTPPTSIQ